MLSRMLRTSARASAESGACGAIGSPDREALHLERSFDAGRERVTSESLVHRPKRPLKRHDLIPASCPGEVVQRNALLGDDAGRSRHPANPSDQHHAGRDMGRGREHSDPPLRLIQDRE